MVSYKHPDFLFLPQIINNYDHWEQLEKAVMTELKHLHVTLTVLLLHAEMENKTLHEVKPVMKV